MGKILTEKNQMSSRRPAPPNEPRSSRKVIEAPRNKKPSSARRSRNVQKEQDSAAHRLSRIPQRYSTNRAIPTDKQETYCVAYFRNNPEAEDLRPPAEKLAELEEKLEDEMDPSEKFTVLIQIKSIQYMVHGENSVESLRSHAALGMFYNENHRPASALRHLTKAHHLEQINTIDRNESITIAIETAESHLALRNEKKSGTNRHINLASQSIEPYFNEEIEDLHLRYKRDITKARISSCKGLYKESITDYQTAWNTLDELNEGEETKETAILYQEIAELHANSGPEHVMKSKEYYQKAYDIYCNLEMIESAQMIEKYLPGEDYNQLEDRPLSQSNQDQNDDYANDFNEQPVESFQKTPGSSSLSSASSKQRGRQSTSSSKLEKEEDKKSNSSSLSKQKEEEERKSTSSSLSKKAEDEEKKSTSSSLSKKIEEEERKSASSSLSKQKEEEERKSASSLSKQKEEEERKSSSSKHEDENIEENFEEKEKQDEGDGVLVNKVQDVAEKLTGLFGESSDDEMPEESKEEAETEERHLSEPKKSGSDHSIDQFNDDKEENKQETEEKLSENDMDSFSSDIEKTVEQNEQKKSDDENQEPENDNKEEEKEIVDNFDDNEDKLNEDHHSHDSFEEFDDNKETKDEEEPVVKTRSIPEDDEPVFLDFGEPQTIDTKAESHDDENPEEPEISLNETFDANDFDEQLEDKNEQEKDEPAVLTRSIPDDHPQEEKDEIETQDFDVDEKPESSHEDEHKSQSEHEDEKPQSEPENEKQESEHEDEKPQSEPENEKQESEHEDEKPQSEHNDEDKQEEQNDFEDDIPKSDDEKPEETDFVESKEVEDVETKEANDEIDNEAEEPKEENQDIEEFNDENVEENKEQVDNVEEAAKEQIEDDFNQGSDHEKEPEHISDNESFDKEVEEEHKSEHSEKEETHEDQQQDENEIKTRDIDNDFEQEQNADVHVSEDDEKPEEVEPAEPAEQNENEVEENDLIAATTNMISNLLG